MRGNTNNKGRILNNKRFLIFFSRQEKDFKHNCVVKILILNLQRK
jgi:hypothetical protein